MLQGRMRLHREILPKEVVRGSDQRMTKKMNVLDCSVFEDAVVSVK
jgi:hypothetical protein